jgi:hypothetical protein
MDKVQFTSGRLLVANDVSDYETQGARPRPERPEDHRVVPPQLRALTWFGVAFLIVALMVCAFPLLEPHGSTRDFLPTHVGELAAILAAISASTGVILLSVRVAAAVLLRAINDADLTTRT